MESYWITNAADRRGLSCSDGSDPDCQPETTSWYRAEDKLRRSWDRFSTYGSTGVLYRDAVIKPLHDRFNAGDRSFELLREILSI